MTGFRLLSLIKYTYSMLSCEIIHILIIWNRLSQSKLNWFYDVKGSICESHRLFAFIRLWVALIATKTRI